MPIKHKTLKMKQTERNSFLKDWWPITKVSLLFALDMVSNRQRIY